MFEKFLLIEQQAGEASLVRQEPSMVKQLGLQRLLAQTAMDLARPLPQEVLDDYLNALLGRLGRLFEVDRCYLFTVDRALSQASNTHEWCEAGITPQIDHLQAVPLENLRWWIEQLAGDPVLDIARVDDLPPEAGAEKELFQAQQIRSIVLVAMHDEQGRLAGFMGFDSVGKERCWSEHERTALLTMSGIVKGALLQQATRRLLRERDDHSRALLAAMPDMMFLMDQAGYIVDFSAPDPARLLIPPGQFINRRFMDVLPPDLAAQFETAINQAQRTGQVETITYELDMEGNGDPRSFEARLVCTADQMVVSIVRDITADKNMERQLREAASVFEYADEGIFITDRDGAIRRVNRGFTRLTGYSAEEAHGQNARMLKSDRQSAAFYRRLWKQLEASGHWSGELWNRRKDGQLIAVLQTITAIQEQDSRTDGYVSLMTDLTEIKQQREALDRIARHDLLTGLGNRTRLLSDLQQAIAEPDQSRLCLVQFDLDDFRAINERVGKDACDEILIRVARRLEAFPGHMGVPARTGGDEFALLFGACPDRSHCRKTVERLLEELRRPLRIDGETLQLTASIGIAYREAGMDLDPEVLLRQADHAVFQAKEMGKNRWVEFDQESFSKARDAHNKRNRIEQGLRCGEFILHYQPQVNARSGQVIGVEALVRWNHPQRGLLPPSDFLPEVSNHPLAIQLGEEVLEMALAQHDRWLEQGCRLAICVNVDGFELNQPDFPARLEAALARHPNLQPMDLQLEVLETSALQDMARTNRNMQDCIRLGVGFSIDDFGTGFSSLGYLQDLPARTLKIDRRFVFDLPDNEGSLQIVKAIIALGQTFDLQLIAEGAETEVQIKHLLELGCEVIQGYGIARPMPAEAVIEWLRRWQGRRSMQPQGNV